MTCCGALCLAHTVLRRWSACHNSRRSQLAQAIILSLPCACPPLKSNETLHLLLPLCTCSGWRRTIANSFTNLGLSTTACGCATAVLVNVHLCCSIRRWRALAYRGCQVLQHQAQVRKLLAPQLHKSAALSSIPHVLDCILDS